MQPLIRHLQTHAPELIDVMQLWVAGEPLTQIANQRQSTDEAVKIQINTLAGMLLDMINYKGPAILGKG